VVIQTCILFLEHRPLFAEFLQKEIGNWLLTNLGPIVFVRALMPSAKYQAGTTRSSKLMANLFFLPFF